MQKAVRIPSNYGPLEVEVLVCDHTPCTLTVLPQYAVGWAIVQLLGELPSLNPAFDGPAHFCSAEHLRLHLNEWSGDVPVSG